MFSIYLVFLFNLPLFLFILFILSEIIFTFVTLPLIYNNKFIIAQFFWHPVPYCRHPPDILVFAFIILVTLGEGGMELGKGKGVVDLL